jgi:putative membrane-bound dehydrogenase-like protein
LLLSGLLLAVCGVRITQAQEPAASGTRGGVVPTDSTGRALNLGFEEGTLRDWSAEGDAFAKGQPVKGDTVATRRSDMKSQHVGQYWLGGFERAGDAPRGRLMSVPFTASKPWGSFLIAGGPHAETRVDIVRADTGEVIARVSGDETENLKPVAVDLTNHQGKPIRIVIVDEHTGHWGHVNFDDFRLHDAKPAFPARAGAGDRDVYAHAGLSPEDAARAMTVPEGFQVTLFAGEPDVVQPIAMTIDARGRLWVAEAYSYPRKVAESEAKDRILIFEDWDNDGKFDTRKVFAEKLNLVSGIEVGHGGVWVGAAPHLLFIPDKDGDDVPDGPARVLLDGWGMQDTHETLNSFIWGPDGWLYGCHGVFTHSNVGKPGASDSERERINAGVWRYHPTEHVFEVFAHGTSNPWGVDFDPRGQCFIEACVIPHLYHMVQGGRYERQAGSHFNPYTYDDIKTIADHRHYVGANPHGGNDRSDSMGGGHAHAGLMIYDGGRWPKEFAGGLFMNNIHGARLNHDVVTPRGSGFIGSHKPDFLLANDRWSQIVHMRSGPDGNMYMIDWYDKNQCHRNEVELHDRTNGRIFKVSYAQAPAADDPKKAIAAFSGHPQTVALQAQGLLYSDNNWVARTAQRRLQESFPLVEDADLKAQIRSALADAVRDAIRPEYRLRSLWALHVTGGLEQAHINQGLSHADAHLRAWTIQLACEGKNPSSETLQAMVKLAQSDPSPVVRLYLASAAQRLPRSFDHVKWGIVEGLAAHAEDAEDPNLPLMVWYALEPLVPGDGARAIRLAQGSKLATLLPYVTRRLVAVGTEGALGAVVEGLKGAQDEAARLVMVRGVSAGLQGRRRVSMPEGWPGLYRELRESQDPSLREEATALALVFGDPMALGMLRDVLGDRKAEMTARLRALEALASVRDEGLPAVLRGLVNEPGELRSRVLRAMGGYEDEGLVGAVLAAFGTFTGGEKRDALASLTGRAGSARALLDAVGAKRVDAKDLTADLVRNLRNLKDEQINARIAEVWGQARETPAERLALVEKYRGIVKRGYSDPPDVMLGRAVFAKTCAQCHKLFGTGGENGPELTGSNRADLDYILTNVADPSALVGKDYQATVIATRDGRTLTGIVKREDGQAIVLATANEVVTIPADEVEERKLTEQSLMPEGQWETLSAHEIRSLVAYLASPVQVAMLATHENVQGFFNGKDLTGWVGDQELWRVEEGEIVGRTSGLDHNSFLRSELAAGDFRLELEVKLVGDEGNSGIQFRSEALPDGEMKGYQADIGPGWWGKLYEENGRGLLWDKSGEEHIKRGEWNTYVVEARGSLIRTWINGRPCVELDDPSGARRGIFALQLHSGGPTEVRFRKLRLEVPGTPGGEAAVSATRR